MTDDRMMLVELLQKSGGSDFLRAVAEAVLQILVETDVEGLIGAGRHDRSAERLNYRNGYRDRSLDTRLGTLSLRIPKLRQGSYFPPFLEPRKTAEKAVVAVIQEAWIGGVSNPFAERENLSGIYPVQTADIPSSCPSPPEYDA
jgi:transposase-like protein